MRLLVTLDLPAHISVCVKRGRSVWEPERSLRKIYDITTSGTQGELLLEIVPLTTHRNPGQRSFQHLSCSRTRYPISIEEAAGSRLKMNTLPSVGDPSHSRPRHSSDKLQTLFQTRNPRLRSKLSPSNLLLDLRMSVVPQRTLLDLGIWFK